MRRARFLLQTTSGAKVGEVRFGRHFRQLEENSQGIIEKIETFCSLDDHDVWSAIKEWQDSEDMILATLCRSLVNRNLFKIILSSKPIAERQTTVAELAQKSKLSHNELAYFYDEGRISNSAYIRTGNKIKMLRKSGQVIDIEEATDLPNINAMSRVVSKNYFCWANNLKL
jgi:hypothetical protein